MSETIKWNELTPGQRDALIAEKVMGWNPKECDGPMGEQPNSSDGWFCQKCGYEGYWGNSFEHTELPHHYTISMDAAWLVLQEMVRHRKSDEQTFELFASHLFDIAAQQIDEAELGAAWGDYLLAAQWTPERIGMAALKACEVEVET